MRKLTIDYDCILNLYVFAFNRSFLSLLSFSIRSSYLPPFSFNGKKTFHFYVGVLFCCCFGWTKKYINCQRIESNRPSAGRCYHFICQIVWCFDQVKSANRLKNCYCTINMYLLKFDCTSISKCCIKPNVMHAGYLNIIPSISRRLSSLLNSDKFVSLFSWLFPSHWITIKPFKLLPLDLYK